MIHSEDVRMDVFAKNLQPRVFSLIDKIKQVSSENQIPYKRNAEGIIYYTFAGYLVNRAIGLFARMPEFKAEDLTLHVPSPIDWSSIPNHPLDYGDIFHLIFETSSKQSLYQKHLPLYLQELEYLQDWLKDKEIPKILCRLSNAETVQLFNFSEL